VQITQKQLRSIQLKQLEIMIEVDEICRKQNLCYYLIGGTLLGAIRHKGFIPWDDDLDIGMPRKDYERFMKVGQNFFSDKLFLQNHNTERNHYVPYAKIRLNNTVMREKACAHLDCHSGVFIDIFPLDMVSANPRVRHFIGLSCNLIHRIVQAKLHISLGESRIKYRLKKFLAAGFSVKCLWGLAHKLLKLQLCGNEGYLTNAFSPYGIDKEMLLPHQYGDPIELEFEGNRFFAPACPDFLLTQVYGDYMTFPPESERKSTHDFIELKL